MHADPFFSQPLSTSTVICYATFMDQANSRAKLAGNAGTLLAIVGVLIFFSGVFSFTPRTFVFTGIAIIVLSYAAFFVEELESRR